MEVVDSSEIARGSLYEHTLLTLGPGLSNIAIAAATLYGLNWCDCRNLVLTIIETDSLLLTKCAKGEWKSPWNIDSYIKATQSVVILTATSNRFRI